MCPLVLDRAGEIWRQLCLVWQGALLDICETLLDMWFVLLWTNPLGDGIVKRVPLLGAAWIEFYVCWHGDENMSNVVVLAWPIPHTRQDDAVSSIA